MSWAVIILVAVVFPVRQIFTAFTGGWPPVVCIAAIVVNVSFTAMFICRWSWPFHIARTGTAFLRPKPKLSTPIAQVGDCAEKCIFCNMFNQPKSDCISFDKQHEFISVAGDVAAKSASDSSVTVWGAKIEIP